MKRVRALTTLSVATALVLTGCGTSTPDATTERTGVDPAAANPYGHVHGITVVQDTDQVLLATHNGLFDAADESSKRIGPLIDLMGFTATDDGTLYASGHPHPDTGIPEPAGLLRSSDGGQTWDQVSRQGQSDFHALTTADESLVAFDGQLWTSSDGQRWKSVTTDLAPFHLAGSPAGTVLATTEQGVWRSADAGQSWDRPAGGPVLLLTTFADADTAVGVAPDGTVHTSDDAGKSWVTAGSIEAVPAAITALRDEDGTLEVWVATSEGIVLHSIDDGQTFEALSA
ncbi:F510_1955 family glycosylhydrolase [Micrococcus luteus]|uniref:F510_1955 family glycosylhydrolase n=1 Tax=Micrococcus luteus TaxID=1270 RepID=UPI0015D7454D|nr:exo-alpha-sialidase [Micrococcus luteus]